MKIYSCTYCRKNNSVASDTRVHTCSCKAENQQVCGRLNTFSFCSVFFLLENNLQGMAEYNRKLDQIEFKGEWYSEKVKLRIKITSSGTKQPVHDKHAVQE